MSRLPRRMARPLLTLISCVALLGLLAGCGNRHEGPRTEAETEGLYLQLGGLDYQIQISRQLNPQDTEDKGFLIGLPEGYELPTAEEAWFAVFLRISNQTDEARPVADDYEIHDADENVYTPVPIDTEVNVLAFESRPLEPGRLIPPLDSAAANGAIKGEMVLFKIPYSALQARPLEFIITAPTGEEGVAELDV